MVVCLFGVGFIFLVGGFLFGLGLFLGEERRGCLFILSKNP